MLGEPQHRIGGFLVDSPARSVPRSHSSFEPDTVRCVVRGPFKSNETETGQFSMSTEEMIQRAAKWLAEPPRYIFLIAMSHR